MPWVNFWVANLPMGYFLYLRGDSYGTVWPLCLNRLGQFLPQLSSHTDFHVLRIKRLNERKKDCSKENRNRKVYCSQLKERIYCSIQNLFALMRERASVRARQRVWEWGCVCVRVCRWDSKGRWVRECEWMCEREREREGNKFLNCNFFIVIQSFTGKSCLAVTFAAATSFGHTSLVTEWLDGNLDSASQKQRCTVRFSLALKSLLHPRLARSPALNEVGCLSLLAH